ncbi:hypothetical protein GALMADRAFT_783507 [Galerina marginata CBS 339.88]|uniref:Uncharacterized protein n=1 Tax=Galerina marginata (strain CBS 339.88) TaxID=685588 RepID=A0A067SW04_GALM3|nr:hypothetical protein GALMADRAFT_783507 [Galerina marginata CBS 339.88]
MFSCHSDNLFAFMAAMYCVVSVHAIVCNNKHIIVSKPLTTLSGDVITMQRFNCSNTFSGLRQPASAINSRRTMEFNTKRAASECTAPGIPCLCGVPCTFGLGLCVPASADLGENDCMSVANSLISMKGTFVIPAGEGVGFLKGDCIYVVSGDDTEDVEYCFDDAGDVAQDIFDVCGSDQVGACLGVLGGLSFGVVQDRI